MVALSSLLSRNWKAEMRPITFGRRTRQRVDQVVGQPVGEVLLVRVAAALASGSTAMLRSSGTASAQSRRLRAATTSSRRRRARPAAATTTAHARGMRALVAGAAHPRPRRRRTPFPVRAPASVPSRLLGCASGRASSRRARSVSCRMPRRSPRPQGEPRAGRGDRKARDADAARIATDRLDAARPRSRAAGRRRHIVGDAGASRARGRTRVPLLAPRGATCRPRMRDARIAGAHIDSRRACTAARGAGKLRRRTWGRPQGKGTSMFTKWMLLGLLAVATGAHAQDTTGNDAKLKAFVDSLHFRSGEIAVPEADAHFRLGSGFRYLDKPDARKVLEQLWGNPPDDDVLGLVVPTAQPLDSDASWAVVVTYSDDGFVSDEDAAKTDYDADAQGHAGRREGRERRAQEGRIRDRRTGRLGGAAALRRRQQETVLGEGTRLRGHAAAHAQLRHPRARASRLPQPQCRVRDVGPVDRADRHAAAVADDRIRPGRALRRLRRLQRQARRLWRRGADRRRPRRQDRPVRQARPAAARARRNC